MEYPGSKFKRIYRVAMLTMFIVAFFLLAPTVILYSSGYRYDFKNGLLREVGSLSIDVLPENAKVFLNNIEIKDKLPIRLNNITPRKYTLLISATGYYDWEKQIEVNKNQTTYIKDVILLRKERPELITKDGIENIVLSNSSKFLAYETKNGSKKKLYIRNQFTGDVSLVTDLGNDQFDYEWAPGSDFLLVTSKTTPFTRIFVVDAENPEFPIYLPTKTGGIQKINWRKGTEPEIYYSTSDGIQSFLPRLAQNRVITKNAYFDWYMDGTTLWTMMPSTTTKSFLIYEDTLGFNSYFGAVPFDTLQMTDVDGWKIVAVYKNNVLLHNAAASKFIIARHDKVFTISGDQYYLSKYNNWLLVWTPWELWTYTDGEDPYLLNRSGNQLISTRPMDQYNTLAMQWNNELTVLYPYYFINRVLQDKPVKFMTVDSTNRTIYYSNSSGLWKLKY